MGRTTRIPMAFKALIFFCLGPGLLFHKTYGLTPLRRLLDDPKEHRKSMSALTRDLIQSMNQELASVKDYYSSLKASPSVNAAAPKPIPRAYQVAFRQLPLSDAKAFEVSIRNPKNYLVLRNSQVECSGRNLLRTEDPNAATFEYAEHVCDTLPGCSYFVWKPASLLSGGAVWYCTATEWLTPYPQINWVVAVRPATLQLDGYDVHLNGKVPCTGDRLMQTIQGPLVLDSAAQIMYCFSLNAQNCPIPYTYIHEKRVDAYTSIVPDVVKQFYVSSINLSVSFSQFTCVIVIMVEWILVLRTETISSTPKRIMVNAPFYAAYRRRRSTGGVSLGESKHRFCCAPNNVPVSAVRQFEHPAWQMNSQKLLSGKASKAGTLQPSRQKSIVEKAAKTIGSSGPIVMHDYSWMGEKGDVVWNPAVGWPASKMGS